MTGRVEWDSGSRVENAQVVARTADGNDTATGTTDVDGTFSLTLTPREPTRVLVEVNAPGTPPVTGSRWSGRVAGGNVDVGTIVLPDPDNAQLFPAGSSSWRNAEGSVTIENTPGNIDQVWAQAYDPADQAEAFPGAFEDENGQPLNSSVFVWVEAVDTANQPVDELSSPATMRVEVPRSQWGDLEDLQPGNGQIDVPIYRYDEDQDTWVRQANGKLVDGQGNPIPESEEANIRSGSFTGPVYVEFQADHFSWWNLDYPPECEPDLADYSDAPDPYPVTKHADICHAWLGPWVDGEPAPRKPDLDWFDDAIVDLDPLTIGVSNWDWPGPLYLNVLIDHNEDGDWQDAGEWVVQNETVVVPPRDSTLVTTTATWDGRKWIRIMLTGVPVANAPAGGEFAIGETEDIKALKKGSVLFIRGNGSVSGDVSCNDIFTCDFLLEAGRTVRLQAVPGSGATFQRWFIYDMDAHQLVSCQEGETSPVCTFTVSGSTRIEAYFSGAQLGIVASNTRVTNSWNNRTCENNDWRTDPDNCRLRFPTAPSHTVTLTAEPLESSLSARINVVNLSGAVFYDCRSQIGDGSYQCTLNLTADEAFPSNILAIAYSW